jgi:intraflagellar transport protein 172
MQIKYWKNLQSPIDGMQKISSMCWSPDSKRLAVSTADRVVQLYDEHGEKKDRFGTRPAEKGHKSYVVRAMAFSSDSLKLAIAQSDNAIFVYKLGAEWKERKSICNKFIQTSSVTCMIWPYERPNEIYFGVAEGKVRVGTLKNNKSSSVYATESYVVSISASPDGNNIVSGHLDGAIITMNLETKAKQKITTHASVPYALAWGVQILAAGNDGRVVFYEADGNCFQKVDYSKDDKVKEFTSAMFNPTGETAIVGNFNRFYVYNYNSKRPQWDEICCKNIENYYSVTALTWKYDSSKIGFGSLCGSIDIFDVCLRKSKYKGKFEFTYVSLSQVIVKSVEGGGKKMVLKSDMGAEITKVNVYQDRYLVGNTSETILLGDMETSKSSEILWRGSGNEKFIFSNPNVCMIYNAGELSIVEYGVNEIIGTCRTENLHPNMISARLNYSQKIGYEEDVNATKVIAYLLDAQTIYVQDLNNQQILAQINHDTKIDYIELNPGGNKLLFRDRRKQLYLYNIIEQNKQTLLNFCSFVNWVPFSDVVVAQNRNNLCVWYSIDEPDKMTKYDIKGDVEAIERSDGKTEVIVDDGTNTYSYALEEALIAFGAALEYKSLENAMEILEPLELTQENEANWKSLAKIALEANNFFVAERCYAALGDVAKSTYYRKINDLVREFGYDDYRVQAKLAVLNKQFQKAEAILLDHNQLEEAMAMYQEVHKWDESIKLAERMKHQDAQEYLDNYYGWLLSTNQEPKAAEIKERAGDYITAINLFLKGGLPAKAANIVTTYNMSYPQDLLEKIASSLTSNNMHEKAGDFFEKLDMLQRALDSYVRGRAFRKAIDLSKRAFPSAVVNLEEEWGDHLASQKQFDLAIGHYKQAGIFSKAVEAAIKAKQWNTAVQLVQGQPEEIARPFYKEIAEHYGEVRQFDLAEKYYIKAGEFIEAFEMYVRASKWEAAYKIISRYLPESEYTMLYIKEAQIFEREGRYKDAERMYITANEPDLAINMYKNAKLYDHMIRLVGKHRKDLLKDTHIHLAQECETDGNHKQAEHHYIEGGQWSGAVDMYTVHEMWDDAIRVAKAHGSQKDIENIAVKVANSMGAEAGRVFLIKNGLVDAAIEFEANKNNFDEAFRLVGLHAKYKEQDVHLKYALFLEDEKRYKEAEEEFIKAGKPTEAIEMYQHQKDWHSALQVARQFHPESVKSVFLNQAKFFMDRRDFAKAEGCYINAKEPESAVNAYMSEKMYGEALRVAKKHVPHMVYKINEIYSGSGGMGSEGSADDIFKSAKMFEDSRDFTRAIDRYLDLTTAHTNDHDFLEEAWERAYTLAMSHDKNRVRDIVDIVGERLYDIRKYISAAEIYESIGDYERAVEIFVTGERFDKAKQVAMQVNPRSEQDRLLDMIQERERKFRFDHGREEEMAEEGDIDGLEMLYKKGKYEQCLMLAERQGGDVQNSFLERYTKQLVSNGDWINTAKNLSTYGCPPVQNLLPVYKTVALEILAASNIGELNACKAMLQRLVDNLALSYDESNPIFREFNEYLVINHYLLLKIECESIPGASNVYCRLCISLLRYTKIIRADKAFLDAGNACKNEGMNNMAFLFLKRYLDLAEAIDDPDNAPFEDNSEFDGTDIPSPFDIPLPEQNLLGEDEREEIRDWVLQIQMDDSIDTTLNLRQCEETGNDIYEATLINPYTNEMYDPCIVSGYPLLRSNMITCKFCNKGAIREYWNEYVTESQKCPWCKSIQTPY